MIARSAAMFKEIKIIAFELMNNHFHFVLSSEYEYVLGFWKFLRSKMQRFYPLLWNMKLHVKAIESLQSLRNNIVYVNRNGYVSNPNCTPFSYPWGTGSYYFLNCRGGESLGNLSVRNRRKLFRARNTDLPLDWLLLDGYIAPSSYCSIKFGTSLFRDAHHYFFMVSKNVEAYSGIAIEIDDGEFLTDSELFEQLLRIIKERYGQASPKVLTGAQKLDLARKLHYDFHASNGQIRRILGLSQYDIDALFPLSAARK